MLTATPRVGDRGGLGSGDSGGCGWRPVLMQVGGDRDATNVASITFPDAEPAPEPVPALPLIAQWLLGLGLLGGGARQLFRRRRQG